MVENHINQNIDIGIDLYYDISLTSADNFSVYLLEKVMGIIVFSPGGQKPSTSNASLQIWYKKSNLFFFPNSANNESSQYHLSKIFKAWIEGD